MAMVMSSPPHCPGPGRCVSRTKLVPAIGLTTQDRDEGAENSVAETRGFLRRPHDDHGNRKGKYDDNRKGKYDDSATSTAFGDQLVGPGRLVAELDRVGRVSVTVISRPFRHTVTTTSLPGGHRRMAPANSFIVLTGRLSIFTMTSPV